jgi:hypothetical protein
MTKCGHVGNNFYIPITFVIRAENAREAAAVARQQPRVKHHHKDAILEVKCINEFEAREICRLNDLDPYLKCKNKQEQRAFVEQIAVRIEKEPAAEIEHQRKNRKNQNSDFLKKKLRTCYVDSWDERLDTMEAFAS